ncbi:MAG: response regulator [Bacteroidia bacterium]
MKGQILIVEDEVLIANVIQIHIENAGYECAGIAIDYEEAIEILEKKEVNMALLDVNISGSKKGTDLAHYINAAYNIPIVFLTAYSDQKTIEEIKTTLPFGYLKKPIDKDNLLIAIEIAINNFSLKQLEKVKLRIGKDMYFFTANELLYAEADHVYVTLVMTTGKNLLLRTSLAHLLEILPQHLLKQINRSQAINPHHIDKIKGDKVSIAKETFKISPLFRPNFEE